VLKLHSYCATNHHGCAPLINLNKRLFSCVGDRQGLFGRWLSGRGTATPAYAGTGNGHKQQR